MKENELLDDNAKRLVSIMSALSESNRNIAIVYHQIHGDDLDMEDDFDFIEAQRTVQSAIKQIGQILGDKIAETFF